MLFKIGEDGGVCPFETLLPINHRGNKEILMLVEVVLHIVYICVPCRIFTHLEILRRLLALKHKHKRHSYISEQPSHILVHFASFEVLLP